MQGLDALGVVGVGKGIAAIAPPTSSLSGRTGEHHVGTYHQQSRVNTLSLGSSFASSLE